MNDILKMNGKFNIIVYLTDGKTNKYENVTYELNSDILFTIKNSKQNNLLSVSEYY